MRIARLEDWTILTLYGNIVAAGKVYDHPNFCDGDEVVTSRIRAIDPNKRAIHTENTIYLVGKFAEPNLHSWAEVINMVKDNEVN